MTVNLDLTPEEQDFIERCCALLEPEQVDDCYSVALEAAYQITEPEVAQQKLVAVLTDVLVRMQRNGT